MSDQIARMDATAQAALIASNEMSPAELVESAIRRIERANPDINAVIHPLFDKAMDTARGDLPRGAICRMGRSAGCRSSSRTWARSARAIPGTAAWASSRT
jgi:Asp-tRNA(Asn)/Glu-tRNA(Gln) amidotransferase A subunit family amidase